MPTYDPDPMAEHPTQLGSLGHELAALAEPGRRVRLGERLGTRPPGIEIVSAVQASLGRRVVVHRPLPNAGEDAVVTLRREAERMAALDHPNVLPIHEIIEGATGPMLVVPWVPGQRWEARLSQPHRVRETFGTDDVLGWHVRVLLQVSQAVQFAHEQGVVHRDLCPDNVWVGDVGEVYVTGWALATRGRRARPATPQQIRTLNLGPYLAPEMVMRTVGRVGPQTDVYQLGGLLYRILTGEPPHHGDDIDDTVRQVLFHDPPMPTDAPPSLARVCQRALSRHPTGRYPDVAAFRAALESALAQRTAWNVARNADLQFDRLTRMLRASPVNDAEVLGAYGALRMGYRRALTEAPDLTGADLRLTRATALVLDHLERSGSHEAAAALRAQDAGADLDRSTAKRPPPSPSRGPSTAWRLGLLGILWLPLLLVAAVGPHALGTLPLTCAAASLIALAVHLALPAHLDKDEHGSAAHRWVIGTPLGLALVLAVGAVAGASLTAQRSVLVLALLAAVTVAGLRLAPAQRTVGHVV